MFGGAWEFRGHLGYTVVIQVTDDENLREGHGGGDGEERIEVRDILEVKLITSHGK